MRGLGAAQARLAWLPAAVAAVASALAGATLAGGMQGPAGNPLAAPGPAAALAATPVVLLAAALLYARTRAAVRTLGAQWNALHARGAAPAQGVLAAAGLPAALALLCGVAAPVPLTVLVEAAGLHAPGHGPFTVLLGGWAASLPTGAVLAAVALAAVGAPLRAAGAHWRLRSAPERAIWRVWWLDAVLVVLAAVLGWAADAWIHGATLGLAAQAPSAGAFGAALPTVLPAPPHFALGPLVYLAPAAFVLGAALLVARSAGAAARRWEGRWARAERAGSGGAGPGPKPEAALVLALRSVGRGIGPWAPLALSVIGAAALSFALSGAPAVGAAGSAFGASAVGAEARVRETWSPPCGLLCLSVANELRSAPPPDVAAANQGLPGVADVAELVPIDDTLEGGAAGSVSVTTWGLAPADFAKVAVWPPDMRRSGPADLRALTAQPRGVVVSAHLAAASGLRPGDQAQSRLLGVVRVVAVAPAWPGSAEPANADWVAANWSTVSAALGQRGGGWTTTGFSAYALFRLAPGAGLAPVESALGSRAVTASDARLAARSGGAGPARDVLWPLAALAAVLWWAALDRRGDDAESLPSGETALALGAEPAAARAAVWRSGGGAALGALAGGLAGWGASVLFWPAVRFGDLAASTSVGVPALGAAVAVLGALLLAWRAVGLLRRLPAEPPDAEIAARLEHWSAGRPEPAAEQPLGEAGAPGSASTPRPARTRRRRWSPRSLLGLVGPAMQRLRFGWPRLLGLAAGLLLAASVAATVPIFVDGSLTRVLQAGLGPVNSRPAGAALVRFLPTNGQTYTAAQLASLQRLTKGLAADLGLPATPLVNYEATRGGEVDATATPGMSAPQQTYVGTMTIDALTNLAPNVRLTEGRMYAATPAAGGVVEAVVSQSALQQEGLQVGRLYHFTPLTGGPPATLRVVGVFQQIDPTGPYWPYRYYPTDLLVSPSAFATLTGGSIGLPVGEVSWYTTLDMRGLTAESVPTAMAALQQAGLGISAVLPNARMIVSPYKTLSDFVGRAVTLAALLRVVSVPIVALALFFVAITAGLIVAADATEIAVYASRGAGVAHIVSLYLLEWVALAIPVTALAPLPAAAFARAMGASSGFLSFAPRPPLPVHLAQVDFGYAAAAAALGVVTALVPVLAALGQSIVAARRRASRPTEQPLWQRAYLDVAALAAMAVAWLIFRHASVRPGGGAEAIAGDPVLFLLPAAFLAVSGLLVVRLVGWGFSGLDRLLGDWADLGVVLPLRRIGRLPSQFVPVLLLLCFTAALGSYSASAARTMSRNLAAAVQYRVGAPLRLDEVSPCVTMEPEVGACLTYDNVRANASGVRPMPPFSVHSGAPGIAAATELLDEPVNVEGNGVPQSATLVLVDPATFAQVGWWTPNLNPSPLAHYLDVLRTDPRAVFLSPDLESTAQTGRGRSVTVSDSVGGASAQFVVAGTVLRWPGADVSVPLAVADLSAAKQALGIIEAQRIALIRPTAGATATQITNFLATRAVFADQVDQSAPEVAASLATPEWAGQSGMLSIGFLVALAVTAAGYLFYATLLLRAQLGQLGLLRALGLAWSRVVASVAVEQGALLVVGAAAGTAAGLGAAALFLPLFRPAFTGPDAPPFTTAGPGPALGQVALVLVVLMLVVVAALVGLLRRMRIGQTVKLED